MPDNNFVPDIKIEPISEDVVMITSQAMRYDAPCKWERMIAVIIELTNEYRDLIDAGEISEPKF